MKQRVATTEEVILEIIGRSGRGALLSLKKIVEDVRLALPSCELTDTELADVAAWHAVASGVAMVAFDLRRLPSEAESPVHLSARRAASAGPATSFFGGGGVRDRLHFRA